MHLDRRFVIIVACSLAWGTDRLPGVLPDGGGHPEGRRRRRRWWWRRSRSPPGAAITADGVKTVRVPENLFPKGGYSRVEEVVGRPVISSIEPDEPVVDSRLAARGSGFGVAPMIPTGMRAVSVRVNDVAGVAGFVLPGMRVDVLVTGRPPGMDDTFTATVLQNVTVLSAGQSRRGGRQKPVDECPGGDLTGGSAASREPDAGGQRRAHSTGAAQFERSESGGHRRA